MTDTPDRDPCEELGRTGPPPPADRLREALWRRLRRRLRRGRWWKRAAVAAALAACYAAGFGTARLAPEPAPDQRAVLFRDEIQPPHVAIGQFRQTFGAAASAPVSPREQEWQALDSPQQRPEAYREAGDRYVAEEGDYQSAVRCYREALDAGSERDLAIRQDDSWLLMVLKDARQKEKRDANPND
jgi:hypothetical protein